MQNWQSYLRFIKLKSFSATPLTFLVGTELLLWDFISATFDSLSKASCTFIVPRCLTMTGYSKCCPKIMRHLFNPKYVGKWNVILCLNKKAYLVQRFLVSNFYWFKRQRFNVTFFTKSLPQCFLLVSVDFLLFKHKNGWDGWVNFHQIINKNTNGISWKISCLNFCINQRP